jgi:hypothetical protein
MWKPGEVVLWRGIRNERVWHVQPTLVVKDSPEELVLTLLPGTECMAEVTYPLGKQNSKRWWDFKAHDWTLGTYIWQTNRLLLIFEPERCYSTILFWDHASDNFLCYYINFQVPFTRRHQSADTLDLELDLIVKPDFSLEWKDEAEYQYAVTQESTLANWVAPIEAAQPGLLDKIETRQYPFDGSWLNWRPDPRWMPPKLPAGWDKI